MVNIASLPESVQDEIYGFPDDKNLSFFVHRDTYQVRAIQSSLLEREGGNVPLPASEEGWQEVTFQLPASPPWHIAGEGRNF